MPPDLTLITIWQHATYGAGFVGDALKARKEAPKENVTKQLGNALLELEKATSQIRKILATSYTP